MVVKPIEVEGLNQFRRSLKQLDSGAPKALRIALNEAVELIIDYARPRVPSRTGRARKSIRARSTGTAARVSAGGRRAPYYPWLDFGGRVGRGRSVERPFYKEGRYLWKALVVKRDELGSRLERVLIDVADRAGLDVD